MTRKLVAFLRGINLGKRRIAMSDLREVFGELGLLNAQTLIASGNVLFETQLERPKDELVSQIESAIEKRFGFSADTIIRSIEELEALRAGSPFANWQADPDCKCYVFFLSAHWTGAPQPDQSVKSDFTILAHDGPEILAIGHKQADGRFGPGLDVLPRRVPKHLKMTNRNWNTIEKMIEKARA